MSTSKHSAAEPLRNNQKALETWSGRTGHLWAASSSRIDQLLSRTTPHLMQAAAIQPSDRVLDIGCGCGETLMLAARAARYGQVVGIDLSSVMLDCARSAIEHEQLDNVDLLQADAQIFSFDRAAFDVAISRLGIMSFDQPEAAFANLGDAVREGGRLAVLTWGEPGRNEIFSVAMAALNVRGAEIPSGVGPFSLADPGRLRGLLARTGWSQITARPIEEPLMFGNSPDEAIALITGFAESRFGGSAPGDQESGIRRLRDELMRRHNAEHGIALGGFFWLTTAVR